MKNKKKFEVIEESRFLSNQDCLSLNGGLCQEARYNSCGSTNLYKQCNDDESVKRICSLNYKVDFCALYDVTCDRFTSCGVLKNTICMENMEYRYYCPSHTL